MHSPSSTRPQHQTQSPFTPLSPPAAARVVDPPHARHSDCCAGCEQRTCARRSSRTTVAASSPLPPSSARSQVRPSLIGYTTVMNALSAAGYVRPALLVFRALCADHDPDERAVHTALRACDGAGRRADGLALLAELAESGAAGEKLARRFRPLWDAKAAAAHKAPAAAAAVAGGSGRGRGRTRGGSGRGSAAPPQWRRRSRRSRKGPPPEHEAARGE